MIFLLLPVVGFAFVGFAYAWFVTYREMRTAKSLDRTQTAAFIGLLAATMQIPLPFVMALFFVDPHNQKGLAWLTGLEVVFFLVSLPGAFARKGPIRWWLVGSSIFFLALTAMIYFVSGWSF